MTEIKTNAIPHRLKNVNKEHPYVAGARDIIDDIKEKSQEQVNQDTDAAILAEKNRAEAVEAFHQNQINALDSQNYYTVEATQADTTIDSVMSRAGVVPQVDTIYRVGSWDGTQYDTTCYSEYAWDAFAEAYKFLDKKQYGIDEEPTAGSKNLTESGGVYQKVNPLIGYQALRVSDVDIFSYTPAEGYIDIQKKWDTSYGASIKHIVIPVADLNGVEKITVVSGEAQTAFGFLADYNVIDGGDSTLDAQRYITAGYKHTTVSVPANANYLYFLAYDSNAVRLPSIIILSDDYDKVLNMTESQNFTDAQKEIGFENLGINDKKYVLLEYWGSDGDAIRALPVGTWFYNAYSNDIGRRNNSLTVFDSFAIRKDCLYLYQNKFYCSYNGTTLTEVNVISGSSVIVQSTGQNTNKVMSQKSVTDIITPISAVTDNIVVENTNIIIPITPTIRTYCYVNSTGAQVENSSFHVYVFDVQNINWNIKITSTTRWGQPVYNFYSSDEFSASTLILSGPSAADGVETSFDVAIPTGAKYLAVNFYHTTGRSAHASELHKVLANPVASSLYGKKWACVGDSLTEVNSKTTKHYYDYVAEETGIIPLVYGVGGSGYARMRDQDKAFYQRILSIDATADIVTIFGSFNDIGALSEQFTLGTPTDTGTSTMGGCINTTIDNLYSIMPLARLGIISPTPWNTAPPRLSGTNYDYVNLIRKICTLRSIPFLDLWTCSNLRPWDSDFLPLAYSHDDGNGVHPDEIGHSIIAPKFRQFIKNLL